jgi:hypothetical protein
MEAPYVASASTIRLHEVGGREPRPIDERARPLVLALGLLLCLTKKLSLIASPVEFSVASEASEAVYASPFEAQMAGYQRLKEKPKLMGPLPKQDGRTKAAAYSRSRAVVQR